jgi:hypothetical protein
MQTKFKKKEILEVDLAKDKMMPLSHNSLSIIHFANFHYKKCEKVESKFNSRFHFSRILGR